MAGCSRIGPATRCVSRRASAPAGLHGAEEAARGSSNPPAEKSNQAGIRGADRAGPPATPEECVIEFESSGGGKMRIQWKATAPPDWASLLRAWRDAER